MPRPATLLDRSLSSLLCRAAYSVVRDDLARSSRVLDRPVPAFVAAPQTFGSPLTFHPHVHALISCGDFAQRGFLHPIHPEEATEQLCALEPPSAMPSSTPSSRAQLVVHS